MATNSQFKAPRRRTPACVKHIRKVDPKYGNIKVTMHSNVRRALKGKVSRKTLGDKLIRLGELWINLDRAIGGYYNDYGEPSVFLERMFADGLEGLESAYEQLLASITALTVLPIVEAPQ